MRDEEERSVWHHCVWFLTIENHVQPQTTSENSFDGTHSSFQHMAAGSVPEG